MGSKTKTNFETYVNKGKRFMVCRNSVENKEYWAWEFLKEFPRCFNFSEVGKTTEAVLCHKCVSKTVEPPVIKKKIYEEDSMMRGWKLMKVYVHKDGRVYHKGIEQPELKNTLPKTELKEKKKKLSSHEKEQLRQEMLTEFNSINKLLRESSVKKGRKSLVRKMQMLSKRLNKL